MSEYKQAHIVWYGIVSFVGIIRNYIAVLKVLDKATANTNNDFLAISQFTIEQQLLSEIAKIFDSAQHRKDINCSMKQLKQLCIIDDKFPDGADDPLMIRVDELCEKYDRVISKKVRNKKIAHHDLESIFDSTFGTVDFNDIVSLSEDVSDVLSKIGELLLGPQLQFPPISDLEQKYQESLDQLTID